jgi:hypothetical protein
MGGCKVESEKDYQVSILDKDFISKMETKRWQHVRVNSPIYLSITIKNFFPYNENKRRSDLVDFSCCFFSFLLQDFFTLKGDCVRLLKGRIQQISFLFLRALIWPNKGRTSSIQGNMFQVWKEV